MVSRWVMAATAVAVALGLWVRAADRVEQSLAESLTPGAQYAVRIGGAGRVQRIAIARSPAGTEADESGMVRFALESVPRVRIGASQTEGVQAFAATSGSMATGQAPHSPVAGPPEGQAAPRHPGLRTIAATELLEVEQWDRRVNRMVRSGELKLRETAADKLTPGRVHQRYSQLYKGVPVVGGDVSRQVDGKLTVSVFGTLYEGIALNPVPKLTTAEAAEAFQKLAGARLGPSRTPELMILPTDDGAYRLIYRARIATADDVVMTFLDADTGETVLSFSDMRRPVL